MNAVLSRLYNAKLEAAAKVATVLAIGTAAASSANAALPPEVATSITAFQTDATTACGLVIAAGVVIWGLIKLGRKFGWF